MKKILFILFFYFLSNINCFSQNKYWEKIYINYYNSKGKEICSYPHSNNMCQLENETIINKINLYKKDNKLKLSIDYDYKNMIHLIVIKLKDGTELFFKPNVKRIYERGPIVYYGGIVGNSYVGGHIHESIRVCDYEYIINFNNDIFNIKSFSFVYKDKSILRINVNIRKEII